MNAAIILIIVITVGCFVFVLRELIREARALFSSSEADGSSPASAQLKALTASRKAATAEKRSSLRGDASLVMAAAAESELNNKDQESAALHLTLADRLRFAKWPITAIQYRFLQAFVTLLFFIPAYFHVTVFLQILVVIMVPAIMNVILNFSINRRVAAFDEDYAVMLMQFVSLLKTGINPISGLEAAAKALDHNSLVRAEIELMINRLRLGMKEEQAIHAFGEDIAHPEIELFVQSLLLNRKVGGTLSATLERLARQVRKRQQFRDQAVAAVGMERMSIYAIAGILSCLLVYMLWQAPDLVIPGFYNPTGQLISQGGLALIVFGFYWSTQVTKIKV